MINTKFDAVIFDMDGTLLQSETYCIEAVQKAVIDIYREKNIQDKIVDKKKILAEVGKPSLQFYQSIIPEKYIYLANEVRRKVCDNEKRFLRAGKGKLFDGVMDMLLSLKESDIRLAMLSNASSDYFWTVMDVFQLDRVIDKALCIGDFPYESKATLLRKIITDFSAKNPVMVGDRVYDIEAGKHNHCFTIGCLYGYGSADELNQADLLINNILELRKLFL